MKGASAQEDVHDVKHKPIGLNEGDFEAILLDGCLGLALSAGNAILILLESIGNSDTLENGSFIAILMALVAMIVLRIGQLATNGLQTEHGFRIILSCHAISNVAAIIFAGYGFSLIAAGLAGVGLVATAFLYGRFLVGLARKALALIINIVFMYVGIMFLLYSQLQFWYFHIILVVAVALSVIVSLQFSCKNYSYGDYVNYEESKQRSIKVKGNNHTLLLLGLMFSAVLIVFHLGFQFDIAAIALGSAVGLAGIVSLLLGQADERTYKEALKKSAALIAALLLLPLPLLPDFGRLILLSIYAFLVGLNIIILLNAIIETSRFDMISPIWLFGQEGSVFFAGIFAGSIFFSIRGILFGETFPALYVTCAVMVIVCAWMQIKVNYQIYPFEPVIETQLDEDARANIEHDGQRKTQWQQKRQIACDRYRLSPREREILQILLKGRDARYIMDEFYISQSTAKTHIYNIYRKFGIHSRQELLDLIEGIKLSCDEDEENATQEKK